MNLTEFTAKWQRSTLTERAASQSHFNDICAVLGKPTPTEADATGEHYTFEKSVLKTKGGKGFADVWLKGNFAWEYKGKKKNLEDAYDQLRQYEEALGNPPLLVVCDLNRFEIHTRFNGLVKRVYAFDLDDLLTNIATRTCALPPLDVLRALFDNPQRLRPETTTAQVTEEVAAEFGKIAGHLMQRKVEPRQAARFLIRILFCLFAEDVGLLPEKLFTRLVSETRNAPDKFAARIRALFQTMAEGGFFGNDEIKYFNGGLFEDDTVLSLTPYEIGLLSFAAERDWANVEPSIFGTLFERSLDPSKRAQLGAHYTSRDDILAIVEPVLMAPLRLRWLAVQQEAQALVSEREAISASQVPGVALTGRQREQVRKTSERIAQTLRGFGEELGAVRVLDPACGSGNFLYVALRGLLDLNKAVFAFATACDVPMLNLDVQPEQMRGIELNEYAHELASITVWIGYIQWLRDSGFGQPEEPILRKLDTIMHQDAILSVAADGTLSEPAWPDADVIIGNPPFLGGNRIRQELGNENVERLFRLYEGRVPAFADLVCYWFERARALIEAGKVQRVGLLSTNSIRGGANRRVLERIKDSGDIFMAWSDRPWVLEGAAVRVSMVGFDNGTETERILDGASVETINPDLTSALDLTAAQKLRENVGLCVYGSQQKGSFDVSVKIAATMFADNKQKLDLDYRQVLKRGLNGTQALQGGTDTWVIDFDGMTLDEAAKYQAPFDYIKDVVYPERKNRSEKRQRDYWWLHARPSPRYRQFQRSLNRCIGSPAVSKHRLFLWIDNDVLADHALVIVGREDDYFFGVLHSRVHELWSLRLCTWLGVGNDPRYTPSTTFETFPFPWSPGTEPTETDSPEVSDIADAARALVTARDTWLNHDGATPAELQKRTLTNLYNARPDWLANAHTALDTAVFAAYEKTTGEPWPADMTGEEMLTKLLALNLRRSAPED